MRTKLPWLLAIAGVCLLLCQCNLAGGGGGETTEDPIVGVWVLSTITDKNGTSQTPGAEGFSEQVIFWGNGGVIAGMESTNAAWGGSWAGCAVGAWTKGGSGSYSFTGYASASSGTATTANFNLGGNTLTAAGANPTATNGPYTLTFIRSSNTPSSSDPLIGTWVLTSVTSPSFGPQTPAQSGCSEIAVFLGDGSLLMGMQIGPNWGNAVGCGVGTWTSAGSGNYTTTAYPTWSSTASSGTLTLSGSTATAPNVPGPGGNSTFTFTKSSASISSSDPLIGTWTVTSLSPPGGGNQTPLQAGFYETAIFSGDGTCLAGMQMGGLGTTWGGSSSTACAVGTWTPGSPGNYSTLAYASMGGGATATTGTMTLSGSVLTVPNVLGSGGNWTITFTKQ